MVCRTFIFRHVILEGFPGLSSEYFSHQIFLVQYFFQLLSSVHFYAMLQKLRTKNVCLCVRASDLRIMSSFFSTACCVCYNLFIP